MAGDSAQAYWVIVVSFLAAFVLAVLPFPSWLQWARPEWLSLTLIYWCIAVPHRVGAGVGWSVGIVMDVMQFTLLGQNALSKTVLAFLANQFHLRIRMYPIWQQCAVVFLLMSIDIGLVAWVHGVANNIKVGWVAWWPAATSMLIWPWLFIILRDARRRSYIR